MTAGALQIRNFHNLTMVKEGDISALGSMGPDFQPQFALPWLALCAAVATAGPCRAVCLHVACMFASRENPTCKQSCVSRGVHFWG